MLLLSGNIRTSYIAVVLVQCLLSLATLSASLSAQDRQLCDKHITVGSNNNSSNCNFENLNQTDIQCIDLQEALSLVISRDNHQLEPLDCVLIVTIQEGHYSINQEITISQNMVLYAASTHDVDVSFTVENSSSMSPSYRLLFIHADFVELVGIEFHGGFGIIGFEDINSIVITDSTFSYFYNGAIDIFMSYHINITLCTFLHNGPVAVIKREQYRGHSGGVSIGYDDDFYPYDNINAANATQERGIYISGCTFRNNTSDPPESTFASDILENYLFPGRGGSISVLYNATFNIDVKIENTVVEDSFAESFGGGMYIAFTGNNMFETPNVVSLNAVNFVHCRCPKGPGGFFMASLFTNNADKISDALEVYNSEFIENYSKGGGGVYLYVDRVTRVVHPSRIENCTFIGNFATEFGAAISLSSLQFLQDLSNSQSLQIVNCVFEKNTCLRGSGVVTTAYLPVAFSGYNKFHQNEGRSLVAAGTRVEIHNHTEFNDNRGRETDSGAVYLTSFGQLELFPGSSLLFQNNSGLLGAAIVVENHAVTSLSRSYSQLLFNPFCPIRSSNAHMRPDQWDDVNVTFTGNEALIGSVVYMNDIDLCSWVGTGPEYFDLNRVFRWNFVQYPGDNINTGHAPDDRNSLWYIQTPPTSIRVEAGFRNISAYPGEHFDLFVVGTDELNQSTSVAVSLSDIDGDFRFNPAADVPHNVKSSAIRTRYTLGPSYDHSIPPTTKTFMVDSLLSQNSQRAYFTLNRLECPPGYKIVHEIVGSHSTHICRCNTENNRYIMDCQNREIYLTEGLWAIAMASHEDVEDAVFVYPCPAHYCRCFDLYEGSPNTCTFVYNSEMPDNQCHCNREGILCGGCSNNTGFSALLNKCVSCSPTYGLLVAALIIADALVIGVILAFKTPPPTWLYPVLFYLQIIPLVVQHFPINFQGDIALYVSSALSFYFVYDFCLFRDLLAELSYFFRYLPFLVSIALSIVILFLRYRHKLHREPWYGIWWVCLFQYTHLIYTSMSVLDCPLLPSGDGRLLPRWYVNGNVQCFTGGHLPLALLAIIVLIFCVIIIPIIFIYSFKLFKHPSWLKYTIGPLAKAFKHPLQWWPAMELLRRVLLVLLIVPFPKNDYPAIFFLALSIAVCGFIQPYKDRLANILDVLLSSSTMVMLLLRNSNELVAQHGNVFIENQTSVFQSDCTRELKGSTLVWIMAPLYYLPLGVLILATTVYLARIVCLKIKYRMSEASEFADPYEDEFEDNHTRRHRSFRTTSVRLGDSQSLFSFSLPRRLTRGQFAFRNKAKNRQNVISMIDLDERNGESVNVNPRMYSMPEQSSQQKSSQESNSSASVNSNTRPVLNVQKKSNTVDLTPIPEMKESCDLQRKRSKSEDILSSRAGSSPTINERETRSVPPDLLKPLLDHNEFIHSTGGAWKVRKKSDADIQVQAVNVLSIYHNTDEEINEV